jgi:hypothetical protein
MSLVFIAIASAVGGWFSRFFKRWRPASSVNHYDSLRFITIHLEQDTHAAPGKAPGIVSFWLLSDGIVVERVMSVHAF